MYISNLQNYRLAIVASGAASGKLLEYEVGGPRVSVQTAYGVEVEVKNARVHKLNLPCVSLAICNLYDVVTSNKLRQFLLAGL